GKHGTVGGVGGCPRVGTSAEDRPVREGEGLVWAAKLGRGQVGRDRIRGQRGRPPAERPLGGAPAPVGPSGALLGAGPQREGYREAGPSWLFLLPRAEGQEGGSAQAQARGLVKALLTCRRECGAPPGLRVSRGAISRTTRPNTPAEGWPQEPRPHDPTVPAEPRPGRPRPSLSASAPGRHRARLPRDPLSPGPKSTGRPETVPGAATKGPPRHRPAATANGQSAAPRTCVTNLELPERVRACRHREVISESRPGRMGRALLPSPGKGDALGLPRPQPELLGQTDRPPRLHRPSRHRPPGTCHPLSQQSPARTRGYLALSVGEEEGPVGLHPRRGACPSPLRSPPRPACQLLRGGWSTGEERGVRRRAGTAPACREVTPPRASSRASCPCPWGRQEGLGAAGQ
uniref:Uncharacterized protein n=1 Tax=Mustela putorius furo TaxID=9669 RepID=M3Z719_MUSPF